MVFYFVWYRISVEDTEKQVSSHGLGSHWMNQVTSHQTTSMINASFKDAFYPPKKFRRSKPKVPNILYFYSTDREALTKNLDQHSLLPDPAYFLPFIAALTLLLNLRSLKLPSSIPAGTPHLCQLPSRSFSKGARGSSIGESS